MLSRGDGCPTSRFDVVIRPAGFNARLVINWRQKSSARSQLKTTIEDFLDSGLSRKFTPELYQQKCSALFE
jgi:type I restriction enzyme R subunit